MSDPYASKKSIKIGLKDLKLFTMEQISVPKIPGHTNTHHSWRGSREAGFADLGPNVLSMGWCPGPELCFELVYVKEKKVLSRYYYHPYGA